MTKRSLDPARLELVETIQEVSFGRIGQMPIRSGRPCLERATEVVQEIRLLSETEQRVEHSNIDLTLKIEFERLFEQLDQLHNGVVDVEIRYGAPVRLFLSHRRKELHGGGDMSCAPFPNGLGDQA